MADVFLQGLALGLAIAAPVGPIGLLCIRRTLAHGRFIGFASGLGAATADAFYGAVAAFGLVAVSQPLLSYAGMIKLIGGLSIAYIAVRIFFAPIQTASTKPSGEANVAGAYFSTLGLTLTNPSTIVSFLAVFAGVGVATDVGSMSVAVLVAGVFAGSALWWFGLSTAIGTLHHQIGITTMRWINRLSGLVMGAFAVAALVDII